MPTEKGERCAGSSRGRTLEQQRVGATEWAEVLRKGRCPGVSHCALRESVFSLSFTYLLSSKLTLCIIFSSFSGGYNVLTLSPSTQI